MTNSLTASVSSNNAAILQPTSSSKYMKNVRMSVYGIIFATLGGYGVAPLKQDLADHFGFNPTLNTTHYPSQRNNIIKMASSKRDGLEWTDFMLEGPNIPKDIPLMINNKNTNNSWAGDKRIAIIHKNIITKALGKFPEEIIHGKINAILLSDLGPRTHGEYNSRGRYIKLALYPQDTTIYHEITHAILLHTANSLYAKKWIKLFGNSDGETTDYVTQYASTDVIEDMATLGGFMFTQEGWKTIREIENPVIKSKVKTLIKFFAEESQGKLGTEYFSKIEAGVIRTPKDAHDYFKTVGSK